LCKIRTFSGNQNFPDRKEFNLSIVIDAEGCITEFEKNNTSNYKDKKTPSMKTSPHHSTHD
jgi:hypothetical protein